MTEQDIYQFIIRLIPDPLMVVVTATTIVLVLRRYLLRRKISTLVILVPVVGFFLFYVWGVIFFPSSLARLAVGRVVSFCLLMGISGWAYLTGRGDV